MKTRKKIAILISTVLLTLTNTLSAQSAALIKTLNAEQITLLENSKKTIKENRKEFKSLLNDDQKSLLKNKSLQKKERINKLKLTLNEKQLSVFEANRIEDKESRKAFRKSLTPKQKATLKKENEARKNNPNKAAIKAQKKQISAHIEARKKALGI